MKNNTLKAAAAVGLSALLMGSAAAQSSVSQPVGYETITVPNGFSYAGLRLHAAPIGSGAATTVAGTTITVANGIVDAMVAGTTYIFEVIDGDAVGAVVLVETFDAVSDTLTLGDDISGDFVNGNSFIIRPAATLASVFGSDNSAGLDSGEAGPGGADSVWIPDGTGGFDRYYFDDLNATSFDPSWSNFDDGSEVNPEEILMIYTDGIILLGDGVENNTFVVSGSVKLEAATYVFQDGFNYIGTIHPVGSTLASSFGAANESGLAAGETGPGGADVIFVPEGGGFARYYYDDLNSESFAPSWSNAEDGSEVDPTTISFDDISGVIVLHEGAATSNTVQAPSFYANL